VRQNFRSPARSGALLLALLAVVLPLARGGVDLQVEAAAIALALVALGAASLGNSAIPRVALALLAVLGVATLQLLPVPAALHALSPGAVRVFEVSLAPLGLYPAARPLSLDPAGSARELAKAIGCTAAFVAAWSYSDTRLRKDRIVVGLALAGVGVSAVTLGAPLLGLGDLLAPRFPFVNPNHLAGFLNLTAFVALGLAFRAHGQARALWAIAFAGVGASVFLSLSRGGIGAFLTGAGVFVGLQVLRRELTVEGSHPARQAAIVAVVGAAVGIAAFLALDPVLAELRTVRGAAGDVKVRLLAPAVQLLRDFSLLGAGPGAFQSVFAAYQSESAGVTFTHLENEWVQPSIDLGLPAGVLLVGTFAWIWWSASRRKDLSSTYVGLLAGTAAVATHNAFDFSLAILGVSLPFAVAMGLLARALPAVPVRPWVLRAGIVTAFAVSGAALAVSATHDLDSEHRAVEQAHGAKGTAEAARAALAWHPADWYSQATAGVRVAAEQGCHAGLPWLLRAMALDPGAPGPHLAAARCLAHRNDAAAKREYRLAILYGDEQALGEAARRYPRLEDLSEIAPDTPDGLLALGQVLLSANRSADASTVFARLRDEYSDARGTLPHAYARAALADDAGALELARRHAAAAPSDPSGWLLAAQALLRLGRADDAHLELERGLAAAPGSPRLLGFLAEQAMAARRWSEAKRLAEEIAPRTPGEIANKHLLVAQTLAGQGRISEALERARSAAAATPEVMGPLLVVADYATRAGRGADAIAALRHAASLPGAPSDLLARRIAGLEAAQAQEQERAMLRDALRGSAP
jgi:predicted Zn-dependent protease